MRLFQGRFPAKILWRSAQEQVWLDMAPVGREFSSKDYERLNVLDMYARGEMSEVNAMAHLNLDRAELAAMLEQDGLFR